MTNYQPAIVCFISCVAWPVAGWTSALLVGILDNKRNANRAFCVATIAYAWLITSWLHF